MGMGDSARGRYGGDPRDEREAELGRNADRGMSYGTNEREQTEEREHAGDQLDEIGEPPDPEEGDSGRGGRDED